MEELEKSDLEKEVQPHNRYTLIDNEGTPLVITFSFSQSGRPWMLFSEISCFPMVAQYWSNIHCNAQYQNTSVVAVSRRNIKLIAD